MEREILKEEYEFHQFLSESQLAYFAKHELQEVKFSIMAKTGRGDYVSVYEQYGTDFRIKAEWPKPLRAIYYQTVRDKKHVSEGTMTKIIELLEADKDNLSLTQRLANVEYDPNKAAKNYPGRNETT